MGTDDIILTAHSSPDQSDSVHTSSFRELDERALIKRIDLRLLPILFLVYVTAFLDRYVSAGVRRGID